MRSYETYNANGVAIAKIAILAINCHLIVTSKTSVFSFKPVNQLFNKFRATAVAKLGTGYGA